MKRNAIIRIILWSTVLVVLLAIFFVLVYVPGANPFMRNETPAETCIPISITEPEETIVPVPLTTMPPEESGCNAVTTEVVNIRTMPSGEASTAGMVEKGNSLLITRIESVSGTQWGYMVYPSTGWVAMEHVELLEPVVEETEASAKTETPQAEGQYNAVVTADRLNVRTMPSTAAPSAGMVEKGTSLLITKQEIVNEIPWGYTPAPVNGWVVMEFVELLEPVDTEITTLETTAAQEPEMTGYGVALDAASIREIEIEWAAGSILIQPMDITEIRITEEGLRQNTEPMVWKIREEKLAIQYSEKTDHVFGIGLNPGSKSKDLIIQVPLDWQCDSLEIDAAAASLKVNDLTIREMEFDGASGTCAFENCTVEKMDLDTASGDVRFTGSLQQLDCDAASADIVLELSNVPRSIDLDTASGDLDVTLPADAGFTVTMDTMSGDFESDFATTSRNGSYVAGNGRCRIDVDAMSGDVIIRKAP